MQLTKKASASSRSLPADATTTRINIASDGSTSTHAETAESAAPETEQNIKRELNDRDAEAVDVVAKEQPQGAGKPTIPKADPESPQPSNITAPSNQEGGWFSWLYSFTTADNSPSENAGPAETSTKQPTKDQAPKGVDIGQNNTNLEEQHKAIETAEAHPPSQKRSWLQMWYGASTPPKGGEEPKKEPTTPANESMHDINQNKPTQVHETYNSDEVASMSKSNSGNARPSGWSFWFRDGSKDGAQPQAQGTSDEDSIAQNVSSKRSRPDSESESDPRMEVTKKGITKVKQPKDIPKADMIAPRDDSAAPLSHKPSEASASRQLQKALPNQVLPRFQDTFALEETPSWWQTIGRFLHYKKEPHYKHVYMVKDPPRIRKALAIGIHGYFPAPLIRTVIGQPTGTSVRFSNMAADAIGKWTQAHGYECDIEKLALEGEGRITERVDLLWKLLLNGMEEIRKADFIMIACHSQGVPVAIMLVAKLIAFGCMNAARVGICAMAGINLGPFSDYRSRWISGSAGELFEFALPHSQVSKDYQAALKTVLDFGVRVSYIGSIDDQLVSLEVSLIRPKSWPRISNSSLVIHILPDEPSLYL